MNALFLQAVSQYQYTALPQEGFHLEHESAVVPSKRIIDVGYDLTVVGVYKRPTKLTTMFETFVSVEIPLGFYAEIVSRSSICKTGYMLANNVGIIDPSFTGTLKVALIKVDESMPDLTLPASVVQLIIKPYVVTEAYVMDKKHITTRRGCVSTTISEITPEWEALGFSCKEEYEWYLRDQAVLEVWDAYQCNQDYITDGGEDSDSDDNEDEYVDEYAEILEERFEAQYAHDTRYGYDSDDDDDESDDEVGETWVRMAFVESNSESDDGYYDSSDYEE
ncbi:Deoxyuridine 5'-triphosphate nucleotidohydrolase [Phytophthora ramorum]|uniref:Deoxyuridine 5'-triphosphate nucleotidohydrolase n=1 Tax=Phytophthora ramorum TaxID=164328 RepID=H3H0R2_PHYRM|nr:Deoxyuridine 5'-triphosphate nucleotidohydrolase [Phytophthora ramorum]